MVKPWAWLRLLMENMKLEEGKGPRIKPLGLSAPGIDGIDKGRRDHEGNWKDQSGEIEWKQTRLILKTRRRTQGRKTLSTT